MRVRGGDSIRRTHNYYKPSFIVISYVIIITNHINNRLVNIISHPLYNITAISIITVTVLATFLIPLLIIAPLCGTAFLTIIVKGIMI